MAAKKSNSRRYKSVEALKKKYFPEMWRAERAGPEKDVSEIAQDLADDLARRLRRALK